MTTLELFVHNFFSSGDLVTLLPPIDPSSTKPGFEDVEELKRYFILSDIKLSIIEARNRS